MTTASDISKALAQLDITWRLDNGKIIEPTEDDVQRVLDKAKEVLYSGAQQVEVGGLLVQRTKIGYDVYVMAGQIKGE